MDTKITATMQTSKLNENQAVRKHTLVQHETKEQLISRLIDKAYVDFKYCGQILKGAKN